MKKKITKHFIKALAVFGILIVLLIMIGSIAVGSSGSRLIQEIVGEDQSLKRVQGKPVVISKKEYGVSVSPESIITVMPSPIIFIVAITNPSKDPLQFSLKNLRCFSEKNDLRILESEEVISEARKDFSKDRYKLNKEQEQELASYIEIKMQMLKGKLLKTQTIAPKGQAIGSIYIQIPSGTERLTIEVTLPNEKHTFDFNVIES